jgi:hypothetical protein
VKADLKEQETEQRLSELRKEKKALKLEKKKAQLVCYNLDAFEQMVKTLTARYKHEHVLDWDEDSSIVRVKCTGEYCHYSVAYHFSKTKKFIDVPDMFRKCDPEKYVQEENHDCEF